MHSGHRSRVKDKIFNFGASILCRHELLEALLFYSIPRVNTNETAHALINRFGSMNGVLSAHPKELMTVEGVGLNSAILISIVNAIRTMPTEEQEKKKAKMNKRSVTTEYIIDLFRGENEEKLYLIALDNSSQIIDTVCMISGTSNCTDTTISKILRKSVFLNATSVIIAHNHPKGLPIPSSSDIEANQKIYRGLRSIEVKLIEHFIVSGERCNPIMHDHSIESNRVSTQR